MYLFLMLLGLASIVYGLYLEGQEEEAGLKDFSDVERLYILEERLGLMEDFLDISHSDYLLDQIERSREEVGRPRELDGNQSKLEDSDWNLDEKKKKSFKREEGETEKKLENIESIDDKYRMYLEYKDRGHSLEEICKLLNMTKGEVILLENLNKDYRK